MSRSIWKGLFLDKFLLKPNLKSGLKIWSRRSIITSKFLNKHVFVYNGKTFKKLYITREKLGFKFGAFIMTRQHTKKIKEIKKKK